MSIDRYDAIRVLGEGSFGKVYLMRDKAKRSFVCVKIIKIKNIPKKEREATKVEVDLLKRLHHPNIVRYVDSFLSKNHESLCICMEYCDGGDLASQIKAARRNLFSESKILHWFVQLALGLHYMHSNKVLHRDLKTQNVFMLGNGRLVLGDLGISKVLDGTMDFAQTCIGTPYYMSPEIFKNKPYSYKSDVWALGCVLYEMTTLSHAFDANSLNGLATKIVKGKYPPIHSKYSRYLRELIGQMLLINPQQRPDLEQILRKPFIKKHTINFFTDIASRPSNSLGEGTMIVKAAAGGFVNDSIGNDTNMISLREQLHSLGMADAVAESLKPKMKPQDDTEAIKYAREQAGALKREQEHKKMVEAALEKLRVERENRAKERNVPRPSGYGQPSRNPSYMNPRGGARAGGVRDRGINWNRRKEDDNQSVASNLSNQSNVSKQSRQPPAVRRRSFGEDKDKERERDRLVEREKREREERRKVEERRREEVQAEARAREKAKAQEEIRHKQELEAAQQKLEKVRAQAEEAARAKREALRERERARQREEIEQLKRDKLELDRRQGERDRLREERRRQERLRLEGQRQVEDKMGNLYVNDTPPARGARSGSNSTASSRAEEKGDELSARDRVLLRRQEKLAQEEAKKLEVLKEAEAENRRVRNQAQSQYRNNIYGDNLVSQYGGVAGKPTGNRAVESESKYEFDTSKGKGRMDQDELHDRLNDATKGKGHRFDSSPAALKNDSPASVINRKGAMDEIVSDDDDDLGSMNPDPDDAANNEEVDEDLYRREEELKAELNFSTFRVEELKRTLQETKSFLGPRMPTRQAGKGPSPQKGGGAGLEEFTGEEDEDSYLEELSEYEESFDDPAPGGGKGARSNSNSAVKRQQESKLDDNTLRLVRKPERAENQYGALQDPVSPTGRLGDRIGRLRQRCVEALGREAFNNAYSFLKQYEEDSAGFENGRDLNDDDYEAKKMAKMRAVLGEGKLHYGSLIEQLIFMEETHSG